MLVEAEPRASAVPASAEPRSDLLANVLQFTDAPTTRGCVRPIDGASA